jgi:hypothetical protein
MHRRKQSSAAGVMAGNYSFASIGVAYIHQVKLEEGTCFSATHKYVCSTYPMTIHKHKFGIGSNSGIRLDNTENMAHYSCIGSRLPSLFKRTLPDHRTATHLCYASPSTHQLPTLARAKSASTQASCEQLLPIPAEGLHGDGSRRSQREKRLSCE